MIEVKLTPTSSSPTSSSAVSGTKTIGPLASSPLGDTIAASTATTATVAVGGSATGVINTSNDHDWFAVQLVAGVSYAFTLDATSNVDPFLRLLDASGLLLRENDDVNFPVDTDSRIGFTATSTGTYYLDAGSYNDETSGSYTLGVAIIVPPPIYTIDQIATFLTNDYWGGPVSHWTPGDTISYNVQGLLPAAQVLARAAFTAWQDVANLTFVESIDAADIMLDDASNGAFANSNSTNGVTTSAAINVQQNWSGEATPGQDSYTFQTFIHEIGHTLGLGHGGFYDGSASYGLDNLYQNDTWATTVMSYFEQSNYNGASERFVMSPMMADIVAVQALYGANTATRAGNTVYGHNSNAGPIFSFATYATAPSLTIWDGGGVDTLDTSGFAVTQTLSLLGESTSSIGGLQQNIHIARNVVIENAIGGSGDDTIIGNAAVNTLVGGANGAGGDTVSYAGSTGAINLSLVAQTVVGGDGQGDTLSGFENAAGGLGADILIGTAASNVLSGNTNNDYLYTGDGSDTAYGGNGVDVVLGQGGNDTLYGGNDTDYIYGDAGTNTMYGDGGVDALYAQGINDVMYGGAEGDYFYPFPGAITPTAFGGEGNDIYTDLSGGAGSNDTFHGENGADYFYGFGGNDTMFGGDGVDVFAGGDGNDTFDGGTGTDYAWGEAGNDTFVSSNANGYLLINDFTAGGTEDSIRLVGTSLTNFAQVQGALSYYAGINTTILTIDSDTNIWLVGVTIPSLTTSDFTFV